MDNVGKLQIMLQHWIEHNRGHIAEFDKWHGTMAGEGRTALANHISRAVEMMTAMNEELGKALHEAGGHHHDEHSHDHDSHNHDHSHSHDHSHDHDHDHDDDHGHHHHRH